MLDERTKMMLEAANQLTTDDIELLKSGISIVPNSKAAVTPVQATVSAPIGDVVSACEQSSRGEYERRRTRESKISTECAGNERAKHDWWPIGTELVAHIGSEEFTGEVVENARVKSGRSVLITSGSAKGKVCLTPTRAALEATEAYRQAKGVGRSGGVTNGWTFWKRRSDQH